MIKTLHTRIVVTFTVVVIVNLTISLYVLNDLYERHVEGVLKSEMTVVGNEIIDTFKNNDPKEFSHYIQGFQDSKKYHIQIMEERNGLPVTIQLVGRAIDADLSLQELMQGKAFNGPTKVHLMTDATETLIGIPFQKDGSRLALLIQPNFDSNLTIPFFLPVAILIVLIPGVLLIIIAARYLVGPLAELTRATQQIAAGNFDVQIKAIRRKDEVGNLAQNFKIMARDLEKLERMRKEFVSNVSHEIQSPLTSIHGFSRALLDMEGSMNESDRRESLEIISRESERLSRLSKNMLKLASLDSELQPIQLSSYDLSEQLREIIVATEPQWAPKNLEFDLRLPKTLLRADKDLIAQVWTNLLHNAIKFTPDYGKIGVKIESSHDNIDVSISDSGVGIKDEEKEWIFERFYKTDRSRERSQMGSGLGLAIVKKIVDIHDGTISVHNNVGIGSIFAVRLKTEI